MAAKWNIIPRFVTPSAILSVPTAMLSLSKGAAMAVQDLWMGAGKRRTARYGRGKRWRVSVPGHPTKAFAVKADAVEWERRLWQEPTTTGTRLTIGACIDTYLAGRANLSAGYVSALRGAALHVHARWGATQTTEVRASDVQAWIAGLTTQEGRPMAQRTRARVLQVLRGALEVALDKGAVVANPAGGVKPGRGAQRTPLFLGVEELRSLAGAAGGYAPMIWLLGTTGVRLGECGRLDVADVNVGRARLIVRRAKSGRGREVPIPATVLAMLDLTAPGPLFRSPGGRRLDTDNWRSRVFHPAREAIGKPELRVHDLRHTAASLMVASGATVKDVQAALGHASAAMTLNVYAHLFDGHLDEVGERMGRLLGDALGDG